MNKKYKKIFTILVVLLLVEFIVYSAVKNYKKYQVEEQHKFNMDVENLNEEKEKKKLNDEFEQNKYLATGKDALERTYNNKQKDIVDLIHKLSLEVFPNTWKLDVKVEEFTNIILLIQGDTNSSEPTLSEIVKYLIPVLNYSGQYLKNVAVYNKKHQCYLFFDEDTLAQLVKNQAVSDGSAEEIEKKGINFIRYNAIKIDFEEKYGHIFVLVTVSGSYGSYECIMMLDTGASMTVISLELAQKTGSEDLNKVSKKEFSTAKGLMSCPIVRREIVVGELEKKQEVAVNTVDDTNLLGVDFFESRGYIIDNSSKCIYVWSKN